jgi:hypothetical protein
VGLRVASRLLSQRVTDDEEEALRR